MSDWWFIKLNNKFVFEIPNLQLLIFCVVDQEFAANLNYVFVTFSFITSSRLIIFLHCFITLLHLVFSFWHIKSLLFPYVFVSTESIYCSLLLSLSLNAILLISVKTLCPSLLNLCHAFNIKLLFIMNSLWFSLWISY